MVAPASPGDGLARWLLGGLVVGGIVLGLLVAAYEIGYHHGRGNAPAAAPATTSAQTATTTSTSPARGGSASSAQGKQLFSADGCAGCHSLDGSNGVGPTIKGLAGSTVQLSDGTKTTADDAYLAKAITDPDAEIVKGYQKGTMSAAVSSFGLSGKPQDVSALVAYIKTQR